MVTTTTTTKIPIGWRIFDKNSPIGRKTNTMSQTGALNKETEEVLLRLSVEKLQIITGIAKALNQWKFANKNQLF